MSTNRITRQDAENVLDLYCRLAGVPRGHYLSREGDAETVQVDQDGRSFLARRVSTTEHDGKVRTFYAIEGGYAIDCAYGGYEVHKLDGGDNGWQGQPGYACTGISCPFGSGHVTAREIVIRLRGAIDALEIQAGHR